ncbi:MAG TPA: hypothetical protein EYH54_05845, partial [Nautiliaceae bacterium]|nr:hypothetical protein [Nautiliaceae bacterium]
MKKPSPKDYAFFLHEEISKIKQEEELKIFLEKFVKILLKNNHLKYKNQIIQEFEELWRKEKRVKEIEIWLKE